jgi:hypothetical protein
MISGLHNFKLQLLQGPQSEMFSFWYLGNGILKATSDIYGISLDPVLVSVFQATGNCHPRNANTTQYNTIQYNKTRYQ